MEIDFILYCILSSFIRSGLAVIKLLHAIFVVLIVEKNSQSEHCFRHIKCSDWIILENENETRTQRFLLRKVLICKGVVIHVFILDATLYDKVCQLLVAGLWFSHGTPVSSATI